MKLTKRQISIRHNFEIQWLTALCEYGIVSFEKSSLRRIFIDEDSVDSLKEGYHYVCCPSCGKKMASVTKKHYKICSTEHEAIYCGLYMEHKKKTDEQKKAQSDKFKARFQTPEGKITLKQIAEASRRLNSDPEFLKRKKDICKEVQNRPEMRRRVSKEMWDDPEFRRQKKIYVEKNIEELKESAKRARAHLQKTSRLHLGYKQRMLENDISGFISEYEYGPYSVDEADPLAKIAVEIDGCYWHGCQLCGYKGDHRIQLTDKKKTSYLKNRGWYILRVKEHEIKKNPLTCMELIRTLQQKRRISNKEKIKRSFFKGSLKVKSMDSDAMPTWKPLSDVLCHTTPHKKIFKICTDIGDVRVTEDHSLFLWDTKEPIRADELKIGSRIIGLPRKEFEPAEIVSIEQMSPEKHTYDVSVPDTESAVLDSGILVHNTYSISGVSLDIEKSSKYQSMKDEFIAEWDKVLEAAKRSIKLIKGLRQTRYGVGLTSALGPLNRSGVQSRRNWVSPYRPTYS